MEIQVIIISGENDWIIKRSISWTVPVETIGKKLLMFIYRSRVKWLWLYGYLIFFVQY